MSYADVGEETVFSADAIVEADVSVDGTSGVCSLKLIKHVCRT